MPRLRDADPAGLSRFVTAEVAKAAGLTKDQIRQRVRSGDWRIVRRGFYERIAHDVSGDRWARRHDEFRSRAWRSQRAVEGSVISHRSAAIVHGLPTVGALPTRTDLTVPGRTKAWGSAVTVVHVSDLSVGEVVRVEGAPVTSVPRTFRDVAATGSLEDAVVLGDAALRAGSLDPADIERLLSRMSPRLRGRKAVERAASLLCAARESPLESLSWVRFVEWALPMPRMQVPIFAGRTLVGIVDFLWEDVGLVGECDGAMKYQRPDDLYREKRREDALRSLGYTMVRWGWSDLAPGVVLRQRLRRLLVDRSVPRAA